MRKSMMPSLRHSLIVAAAALLGSGCAEVGMRPWPAPAQGETPSARSGALFRLKVDADMGPGFSLGTSMIRFPRYEEVEKHLPVDGWATLAVPGAGVNKPPYDVVLLPLPPGDYYSPSIGTFFSGNELHTVTAPMTGQFEHFTVRPGRVTVLGELDVTIKNEVLSEGSKSRQISTTIKAAGASSAQKKLEVLDAALAAPEAGERQWLSALHDARDEAAAAGDFGAEYSLVSWPSRADAAVAKAHPPTAALLKVRVDDTGNAFPIQKLTVYFRRADQANASAAHYQTVEIPGGQLNRFPYDTLLVPLSPGAYAGALIDFTYGGGRSASARLKGDFDKFEIEPGKVASLGVVDVAFAAKAFTGADGRSGTQADVKISGAGYAKKDEPLDAALARPEAAALGWREALAAAKAALPAAAPKVAAKAKAKR